MTQTPAAKPQPEPRDAYKTFRTISTRWMDNDAYGHVNNVVYYSWFDTVVNAHLIEEGALDTALDELDRRFDPGLVIYLAGADPHEGDRLGRLKLTWDGLEARDRRVFDWAWQRRVPLAFAMAGGYGVRIEDTVQAQVNTFRVATQYFARWQNQAR